MIRTADELERITREAALSEHDRCELEDAARYLRRMAADLERLKDAVYMLRCAVEELSHNLGEAR